MRKCLWVCIIVIALFLASCTQNQEESLTDMGVLVDTDVPVMFEDIETTSDLTVTQSEQSISKGFLWETSNGDVTVYLLGSIHIGQEDMYPLRKEIVDAFQRAHYLMVEIDISSSDQEIQQLEEIVTYPEGIMIKDHISDSLYEQLVEVMSNYRLRPSWYNQFKPWYLAMLIPTIEVQSEGWELGIDNYFIQLANTNNVPIVEIEGMQQQLDLFHTLDNMSLEDQESLLKATIDELGKQGNKTLDMLNLWKSGDLQGLVTLVNQSYYGNSESEKINRILLDERNKNMVSKLEEILNSQEKKTYFVVVGAAHLVGDNGIVQLLEDKGFEVIER